MDEAKKKKNAAVLQVLEREAAKPKPVDEAQMEAVRSLSWFPVWRANLFKLIDRAFDADATQIDLLVVMGEDRGRADGCGHGGSRGGLQEWNHGRQLPAGLAGKARARDARQAVEARRRGVRLSPHARSKARRRGQKASKYDKTGTKIVVAWAMMEAYPVA